MNRTRSTPSARHVFAANVRHARMAYGWSQMVLAEKAGLHFTYVSAVECAKRNVSIDAMSKLAAALGCKLADLLREDEPSA